jgi:hypothetical protein
MMQFKVVSVFNQLNIMPWRCIGIGCIHPCILDLHLPGLELQPLDCLACSQSLSQLLEVQLMNFNAMRTNIICFIVTVISDVTSPNIMSALAINQNVLMR